MVRFHCCRFSRMGKLNRDRRRLLFGAWRYRKRPADVDDYDSYVAIRQRPRPGRREHLALRYMEDESESNTTDTTLQHRGGLEALHSQAEPQPFCCWHRRCLYARRLQAMLRRSRRGQSSLHVKDRRGAVSHGRGPYPAVRGWVLSLSEDRKAVMASNLMVVLCSESVLNTGSLQQ